MTTQFITNQEKLLSDVVKNILPCSKTLYFLVGYFHFSGFEEVYKKVADKEIKILVGLAVSLNPKLQCVSKNSFVPKSIKRFQSNISDDKLFRISYGFPSQACPRENGGRGMTKRKFLYNQVR